jgi:hypothetical protein
MKYNAESHNIIIIIINQGRLIDMLGPEWLNGLRSWIT